MKKILSFSLFFSVFFISCELEPQTKYITIKEEPSNNTTSPKTVPYINLITGDSKVIITWENPEEEDLFAIKIYDAYLVKDSSKTMVSMEDGVLVNPKNCSYIVYNLINDSEYSFRISTIDKNLNESSIKTINGTPKSSIDKTPPMDIKNLNATIGDGKILLDWENPNVSNLLGVTISMTPAESSLKTPILLRDVRNFEICGLQNNKNYTFTVKSIDSSLNESSGYSITAHPIDLCDKTPPSPVSNINAIPGNRDVLLEWTNPSDSDFAGVEISMNPAESSLSKPIRLLKSTSFAIGNLENGTRYTFTISAFDINNNFSNTKSISAIPKFTEIPPMEIMLEQEPKNTTSNNVSIIVNPITDASIKKVSYRKGFYESAAVILNGGTEICQQNGIYKFEVSENGYYSIASQDVEGRRECAKINITNIDRIAPHEINNLTYKYLLDEQKIQIDWTNPSDTDFSKLIIEYEDGKHNFLSQELNKTETSFVLNNIESNENAVYNFNIKTIDKVGNESGGTTFQVNISAKPYISSIDLSRSHIANDDSNKNVKVTAYGVNFDELATMEDSSIFIQIVNNSDITSFPVTNIDTTNNKCEVDITVPTLQSVSSKGTDLIIRGKICGVINDTNVGYINISRGPFVSSVKLSETCLNLNNLSNTSNINITITGSNLDIPTEQMKICFYNSDGELYSQYDIDAADEYKANTIILKNIPIPTVDDIYTVKIENVLFDSHYDEYNNHIISNQTKLQIYDNPKFDALKIPSASIHKMDTTVTAYITGKNFTSPQFEKNNFVFTSTNNSIIENAISTITVYNNNYLEFQVKIPNSIGNYPVSLKYKDSIINSTFEVKNFLNYNTGDVLYSDGSHSSIEDVDKSKIPIAVILQDENGFCYAIGLIQKQKKWATWNTFGCSAFFKKISCYLYSFSYTPASSSKFIGDLDGFDNWDIICENDPSASSCIEANYPAFNFVKNYATEGDVNLQGTEYENNWFIPSMTELVLIHKNLSLLNNSLKKINGTMFSSVVYCSSNMFLGSCDNAQSSANKNTSCWCSNFSRNGVDVYSKDYDYLWVRPIRKM